MDTITENKPEFNEVKLFASVTKCLFYTCPTAWCPLRAMLNSTSANKITQNIILHDFKKQVCEACTELKNCR